jgi:hypothetical protein
MASGALCMNTIHYQPRRNRNRAKVERAANIFGVGTAGRVDRNAFQRMLFFPNCPKPRFTADLPRRGGSEVVRRPKTPYKPLLCVYCQVSSDLFQSLTAFWSPPAHFHPRWSLLCVERPVDWGIFARATVFLRLRRGPRVPVGRMRDSIFPKVLL